MNRIERRSEDARKVAQFLEDSGEHKRAEDIRALCRSAACLRAVASALHRELEDTRRACGLPTWEKHNPPAEESGPTLPGAFAAHGSGGTVPESGGGDRTNGYERGRFP